eukprot:CAMPEP_0194389822 /NCGR_PEP_ID=MMETSP0174-20130528/106176_1 /TAXON_ID=216777 /ORGANISM="Proboscia alata, Strain PI-D3" /LENGTH=526 /DNA_ID=CAMNT_0039182473 /DNA_START=55 /DNA_END=1636 /DNA_ORIENTATION=-
MASHGDVVEQQIDDLRERMRLLQHDRRANVEILEATKTSNSEEMRSLREEIKNLRTKQAKLQRSENIGQKGSHEIENIQKEALNLRAEYDSLKVIASKCKTQLTKLKDEEKICVLESKRPSQDDTPLARQIRTLENRLDKGMIKYNEAQSIRNTYQHIVKRLKEERISFDNQLAALDRTLHSKQKDYGELMLLGGDASHAREVSQQELHRARLFYEENKSRRDTEFRERQQLVKIRRQMIERQKQREEKQREIIDKQFFDDQIDREGEAAGRGACFMNPEAIAQEEENKIDIYESAFRKIKEATGVSDVNEVIRKIIGQGGTTENLMSLTRQNQASIEQLSELKGKLIKEVEDLKYNGSEGINRRKIVEEQEDKLASSMSHLGRCRTKCDRFVSLLISAKSGVKHLQGKVNDIREDIGFEQVLLTDQSIVQALRACGDVLREATRRIDISRAHRDINALEYSHELQPIPIEKIDAFDCFSKDDLKENRPYNQRINLPSINDDIFEYNDNYSDGLGDIDEDELHGSE